eukprot:Awhi_evm1s3203
MDGDQDHGETRSCLLSNICFDRKADKFLYFQQENDILSIDSKKGIITNFSEKFLSLRRFEGWNGHDQHQEYLSPIIRKMPIPALPSVVWSQHKFTGLYMPFWPENFGHAVFDDFFAVFVALGLFVQNFTEIRDEIEVISFKPCYHFFGENSKSGKRACKFSKFGLTGITDNPLETLSEKVGDANLLCFQNLIAGTSQLGMSYQGILFKDFVKDGRRSPLNIKDISQRLKIQFSDYDVSLIDVSKLDLEYQIKLAQEATIVITPCGGLSFFTAFMASGTCRIIIDYFDSNANASGKMEAHVWQWQGHIKTYHYPLAKSDITISSNSETNTFVQYRDYGRPLLQYDVVEQLVEAAIVQ